MGKLSIFLALAASMAAQDSKRELGVPQIRLFTGFNLEDGRVGAQPTAGAGFDIGLNRWLAVTTGYSWNRIAGAKVEAWNYTARARAARHDLLGGLRAQVPNPSRLTPFVSILAGVTIVTANAFLDHQRIVRDSMARPAAGVGAGFEVRMGAGFSVLAQAQAVRPQDMRWYGNCGFGIAYRTPPKSGW